MNTKKGIIQWEQFFGNKNMWPYIIGDIIIVNVNVYIAISDHFYE